MRPNRKIYSHERESRCSKSQTRCGARFWTNDLRSRRLSARAARSRRREEWSAAYSPATSRLCREQRAESRSDKNVFVPRGRTNRRRPNDPSERQRREANPSARSGTKITQREEE